MSKPTSSAPITELDLPFDQPKSLQWGLVPVVVLVSSLIALALGGNVLLAAFSSAVCGTIGSGLGARTVWRLGYAWGQRVTLCEFAGWVLAGNRPFGGGRFHFSSLGYEYALLGTCTGLLLSLGIGLVGHKFPRLALALSVCCAGGVGWVAFSYLGPVHHALVVAGCVIGALVAPKLPELFRRLSEWAQAQQQARAVQVVLPEPEQNRRPGMQPQRSRKRGEPKHLSRRVLNTRNARRAARRARFVRR